MTLVGVWRVEYGETSAESVKKYKKLSGSFLWVNWCEIFAILKVNKSLRFKIPNL